MPKPMYTDDGVSGVRKAEPKDEFDIYTLLLMLHAENAFFRLNPEKVVAGIRMGTQRRGGIIYVIDGPGYVVASLGMVIMQDWYSDDEFLSERWNYVHPDFRRSDYGRKLLEQSKWTHEWFKRHGLLMPVQVGINSFDRTGAKIRLYARHMPCIGAYFMYGHPLRQGEKVDGAIRVIEETARKARMKRTKEVAPAAEAVIRCSQSAEDHVQ